MAAWPKEHKRLNLSHQGQQNIIGLAKILAQTIATGVFGARTQSKSLDLINDLCSLHDSTVLFLK